MREKGGENGRGEKRKREKRREREVERERLTVIFQVGRLRDQNKEEKRGETEAHKKQFCKHKQHTGS